jgi:hypothetical protein
VVSLGGLVRSLTAISFAIGIAASVLPAILVALLWTCAKVLRHRATITAPHYTGVSRLLMLCMATGVSMTYLDRLAGLG